MLTLSPVAYPHAVIAQTQLNYDLQPLEIKTEYPSPEPIRPGINADVVTKDPEAERIAMENWDKEQAAIAKQRAIQKKAATPGLSAKIRCSCVLYVKYITGQFTQTSVGAARNWPINATVPAERGVVVFTGGKYGHVAYYVRSGNMLILQESNQVSCTVTAGRAVPIGASNIKGYWNF